MASKKLYILFAPLLVVYLLLVIFSAHLPFGDELRYLQYAQNLLDGSYTDPNNPDLTNGPGYPLILVPFVMLELPNWISISLNAFFVYLAIIYFYKTLLLFIKEKLAAIIAYALGLYLPLLKWIGYLYSEAFTILLICLFMYSFCKYLQNSNTKRQLIIAGFSLGLLILTKIIFFQVLLVSTLLTGAYQLFKPRKRNLQVFKIVFLALITCLPYVIYAYFLTGKPFYLGTRGGELLYHRSTPYDNEWGNWISSNLILNSEEALKSDKESYHHLDQLAENHREFYLSLEDLSNIERDSAFKAVAIANMKAHPKKYLKNTISNIGRLLFNYPNSYRSQDLGTYGYIFPNMILIIVLIVLAYPIWLSRQKLPFEIVALTTYFLIYTAAIIFLHGKPRYFLLTVPSLFLLISYCLQHLVAFRLKKKNSTYNKSTTI